MRVVVTGVAGFIGSQLAERVVEDGGSVVGVDRFSDYYSEDLKRRNLDRLSETPEFELIVGDLAEFDVEPLLDGVDVVYHLAAQPGVRASWGRDFEVYVRDNVLATQRVFEAARAGAGQRVVFASSSSVYGNAERFPVEEGDPMNPVSPYGVTKLAAEHLARAYWSNFEVPTIALRYFTIFGPRQRPDMAFARFIDAAIEGRPVEVLGDGLQARDFTFVDDAVAATLAAGQSGVPGRAYNIAGGTETTVLEAIELIARLLDSAPKVVHLPAAPGDVRKTGADTSLAREDLGYRPQVSLEQGLAAQVEEQRRARGLLEH